MAYLSRLNNTEANSLAKCYPKLCVKVVSNTKFHTDDHWKEILQPFEKDIYGINPQNYSKYCEVEMETEERKTQIIATGFEIVGCEQRTMKNSTWYQSCHLFKC